MFKRLLILFIVVGFFGGWVVVNVSSPGGNRIFKDFTVAKGESLRSISDSLEKQGLIRSSYFFRSYVAIRGWARNIQAGDYKLSSKDNLFVQAQILADGPDLPAESVITIKEGWNNREIGEYLEERRLGSQEDFLKLASRRGWQKYQFLDDKPHTVDIEGYFFPDTYRIYSKATLEDIGVKMLDNFDAKLTAKIRADIKKRGSNIHEIITLASIIEEEVSSAEDRSKVADIFYKRMKIGMPLQADSTVNYITGKGETRSSLDDIKLGSPYNTYKYPGLPPGPISNPGLSSIMAAVYPEPNPYYYFLTSPDGKVYYAKTFEEHKKNRVHL